MDKLSIILITIAVGVFIFSFWSFLSVRKHIKQFKNNHIFKSSLTDEKYFELKSKQEYIIAVSAVVLSILSFMGYKSIDDIKSDMRQKVQEEIARIDTLKVKGDRFNNSVDSSLVKVYELNKKVGEILTKDLISNNIMIVDPIRVGDLKRDKSDIHDEHIFEVKFSSLKTINGKPLPLFKQKPSVICVGNGGGGVMIVREVLLNRFIVQLGSYTSKDENDVTFAAWITEK